MGLEEDIRDGEQTSRLNAKKHQERRKLFPLSGSSAKAGDRLESSKDSVSILMVKAGITPSQAVLHHG